MKKVLIMDDEKEIREEIGRIAKELGCEVFLAGNGAEGLLKYYEEDKIDLVVVDLVMPVLDGKAVIERVKVPVLLLYWGKKQKERATKFSVVLQEKPFEREKFKRKIGLILGLI